MNRFRMNSKGNSFTETGYLFYFLFKTILESESLNHHNLNLQRMLIQEYGMTVTRKQVLPQAGHDCGHPKDPDVLRFHAIYSCAFMVLSVRSKIFN
jgi:hypothetical protein